MSDQKKQTTTNGDIVVFRNGMRGEVIGVRNPDSWREELEVDIEGTRCYVQADKVKVLNVLDRIARAVEED